MAVGCIKAVSSRDVLRQYQVAVRSFKSVSGGRWRPSLITTPALPYTSGVALLKLLFTASPSNPV